MLSQRHHIHVPFHNQHPLPRTYGFLRLKQAIQLVTFFKQRRFRRIEIFGLAFVQHAPAKADDLSAHIDDGKHDPVAKPVVALVRFAADHQAGLIQCVSPIVRKGSGQILPAFRRIADGKFRGNLAAQAAPLEVVNCPDRQLQLLTVIPRSGLHHFIQIGRDFMKTFTRTLLLRDVHSHTLRQVFDSLDKAQTQVLHDETYRRPMHTTTEAMVKLLGLTDCK